MAWYDFIAKRLVEGLKEDVKKGIAEVVKTEREKAAEIPDITPSPKMGTDVKGLASGLYDTWGAYFGVVRKRSVLTYDQLRRIYIQSSVVRPCVDSIVRSVTTCPWQISPVRKEEYDPSHIEEVEAFFLNPNRNKENLQQILSKVLSDILVIDAGVIEKVKNPLGKLMEIYARDGATFVPDVDDHGVVLGYKQRAKTETVSFSNDEIIYFMLYPRSESAFGTPIIESIVDEVATLMFSSATIAKSFTEDEIPDGVLSLGEIGLDAYERAKADFTKERGISKEFKIRVVRGAGKVEWIPFSRPFKDMQLAELRNEIEKIVYRNFGVMPIEMGVTEGMPRAVAREQIKVSESKLTDPIKNLLTYFINTEIIASEFGFKDVLFEFVKEGIPGDSEKSSALTNLEVNAVMTPNEARSELGLKPYPNKGDRPFVIVGQNLYFLDELEKGMRKKVEPEEVGLEVKPGEPIVPEKVEEGEEEVEEEELLGGKRGPPNTLDLKFVKGLAKDYEVELRKVWEEGKVKVLKLLEREETAETLKKVDELLDSINEDFSALGRTYFPIAFYMGQEVCRKMFGRGGFLAEPEEVAATLEKRYKWNEKFLRDSLFKDLRDNIKAVYKNRKERVKAEYPLDNYENAFLGEESRLGAYSGAMNGLVNDGMESEYDAGFEETLAYWHTTSGRPCSDCAALEAGSPYVFSDLPSLPGDGSTACDGYCWCNIVLWRSGEPRLPSGLVGEPLESFISEVAPKVKPVGKGVGVEGAEDISESLKALDSEAYEKIIEKKTKAILEEIGGPRFDPEKARKEVLELLKDPRFKRVFGKEEIFKRVEEVTVRELLPGIGARYDPFLQQIVVNKSYVRLNELAHEFGHAVSVKTRKFAKPLLKYGKEIEQSYRSAFLKFAEKAEVIGKQGATIAKEVTDWLDKVSFVDIRVKCPVYSKMMKWDLDGCLRAYAFSSPAEYIATGFEKYVENPGFLKKVDSSLFRIIDNFVKGVR